MELKKQCKCELYHKDIHYAHLKDMMYEIKPEWVKDGMFKI